MTRTVTPNKLLQTIAVALALAVLLLAAPGARAQSSPDQGPGGPVLVVTDPGDPFGTYYAEILRAEGLNEFAVTDTGEPRRGDAGRLPGRRPGPDRGDRRPDDRAHQLGAGRRQPHRHAPRRAARRPARPGRPDGHGQQRLHQGQHRVVRRRRHHGGHDADPRRRGRDAGDRRDHRGDALLERHRQHLAPRGDPAQRRLGRRSGRGLHLRPGPLDRGHPPGQHRLGRPEARRRRSTPFAPTTSSSPTGWTSARCGSRRPTSSSACWPTSSRR